MLECIMLVGLPGTGKSTWVKNQKFFDRPDWIVLSTDNYIDSVALGSGKTYSEVFPVAIKDAEKNLKEGLEYAIKAKLNIVWDQTNLSRSTRLKKITKVPLCYRMVARVFPVPDNHAEWLNSAERAGKVIPRHVRDSMRAVYEEPTIYEGFDEVITSSGLYPIYNVDPV